MINLEEIRKQLTIHKEGWPHLEHFKFNVKDIEALLQLAEEAQHLAHLGTVGNDKSCDPCDETLFISEQFLTKWFGGSKAAGGQEKEE